MEKFKWCVNRFFNAFGKAAVIVTVIVTLNSITIQDQGSEELMLGFYSLMFNTLAITMIALIPGTILEMIFLNNGPYESSLWFRRMAFTVLYGICFASVVAIFGIVEFNSGVKLALYFIEMIAISFTLGMTSFLIRDAKQKKKIENINEKLNEFDQE